METRDNHNLNFVSGLAAAQELKDSAILKQCSVRILIIPIKSKRFNAPISVDFEGVGESSPIQSRLFTNRPIISQGALTSHKANQHPFWIIAEPALKFISIEYGKIGQTTAQLDRTIIKKFKVLIG